MIEDSKRILPIIPGLSSGAGKMIYVGSIGTQIANEILDAYRCVVLVTPQPSATKKKSILSFVIYE